MTIVKQGMTWLVVLCALLALTACGADVTEDSPPTHDQVAQEEQAVHGYSGHRHVNFLKRILKYKKKLHHPGKKPPKSKDKKICEAMNWECGKHWVRKHPMGRMCHGGFVNCGYCGDDAQCELGQCVMDCEPDGTTETSCSDDLSSVEVADSCGTVVETIACAYGCDDGACVLPRCGDGTVQSENDEDCDDGNLVDDDGCTNACTLPACGDGVVQSGEQCDDGNDVNTDACDNNCLLETCGDGVVDDDEACDDGNTVNDDACSNNCTLPVCGDGVVQSGEQCDDANTEDTDACTATCQHAVCGDGIVYDGEEACDDGNTDNLDTCSNSCTLAVCGDGLVQSNEECDDGNQVDTDLCTTGCMAADCGDGIVQPGNNEACDDGNTFNNDACTNACQAAQCGDGFVQAGEICDDGNQNDADFCTNACVFAACGDGIVQTVEGEQCDDGNTVNDDACSNLCRIAQCNDGIVQGDEECDDGNPFDTDGCTTMCLMAFCGDGYLQASNGELCDDANPDSGDGCSEDCQPEDAFVFVSSKLYTGNMGGLEGADAECQELAEAAGLPGTYKAWLSVSGVSGPSETFTQWPSRYVLLDGTVIADNWMDLSDFSLDAAISLDEYGAPAPLSPLEPCFSGPNETLVWSGTSANGNRQNPPSAYCEGWTSTAGSAHTGDRSMTNGEWSQSCFPLCSYQAPVYCFAQSLVSPAP